MLKTILSAPKALLTGGGTAGSLSTLLSDSTELLTWTITGLGSIVTLVTTHDILLIMVIIYFVSFVYGLFFRTLSSISLR